jgi:hypothetical protein
MEHAGYVGESIWNLAEGDLNLRQQVAAIAAERDRLKAEVEGLKRKGR